MTQALDPKAALVDEQRKPTIDWYGFFVEVADSLPLTPSTVAGLPAVAQAKQGARGFVTDATATTFHSVVVGGGTNKVPVVFDGTDWRIGG